MKNHYSVLGVMPTADLVVIKAAWRALCQMYHPDKHDGDKVRAEALTKELNEAWSVLSDPVKRRAYDQQFAEGTGTFGEPPVQASDGASFREQLLAAFPALSAATEYYPDIWDIIEKLQCVSWQLAAGFVAALLETQAYKDRQQLADALSERFFSSYFGNNAKVLQFAKTLVSIGAKDAALELNRAVNVLGPGIEADVVIPQIDRKFGIANRIAAHTISESMRLINEHAECRRRQAQLDKEEAQRLVVLAVRELKSLQSRIGGRDYVDVLAASKPIREALGIGMNFEKSGSGIFASFSSDVVVFKRGAERWSVPLETPRVHGWVLETLLPLAGSALGIDIGAI